MRYFAVEQFVFGYLLSISMLYFENELLPLTLCVLTGFIILIYRHSKFHKKHRAAMLCVFLAGILLSQYLYSTFLVKRDMASNELAVLERYEIRITSFGDASLYGVTYAGCVVLDDQCAKVRLQLNKGQSVSRGDRLMVHGKFSSYKNTINDYQIYLWNQGYVGDIHISEPVSILQGHSSFDGAVISIRAGILSRLQQLSFPANQIVPGILIGNKDSIDTSTRDVFLGSGLIHILVLSGYNISIVALAVFYVLKFSPYAVRLGVTAVVTYTLVIISGSEEPAVRALLMTMFALALLPNLSSTKNAVRITGYVAAIMLIVSPETIHSISFQLSTLATLAVFTIGTITASKKINPILSILYVTVAAQLFTLPLVLLLSGQYNASSILANLFTAPLIPILMFFGAAYCIVPLQIIAHSIEYVSLLIYSIAAIFSQKLSVTLHLSISHETVGALNILLVFLLLLLSSSVSNKTYKYYNRD